MAAWHALTLDNPGMLQEEHQSYKMRDDLLPLERRAAVRDDIAQKNPGLTDQEYLFYRNRNEPIMLAR